MLAAMKQDLHDRLWRAHQRWFELRAQGETKRALKLRGLREAQDPNRYTRNLIFAGSTRLSYERVLKGVVEFAHHEHECQRLDAIGRHVWRAFMERAIEQGLAAKTLHQYRSAIAKLAAVSGQTASGAAFSIKYGQKIRAFMKTGKLRGPSRGTPSSDVAQRTVQILRAWDARHFARTDEPRAYQLVARVQLETGCRRISATSRLTADSLRADGKIALIGKGGRQQEFTISPELHGQLSFWLSTYEGPLADAEGYRVAYARAVEAAGGRVTGSHGLRRLSTQQFYSKTYHQAITAGLSPGAAAAVAKGDAVQRLGHSRHRTDVARCYFDAA